MTPRARIAIIAIAAVGLVVAFFGARGSDDQDDPPTTTAQVTPAPGTAQAPPATTEATTPQEPTATTGAPTVQTIVIRAGKPVGGVAELTFSKGEQVRFAVRSDVADEVHVHGYDIKRDVAAGGTARFSFDAEIEGRFEVELEDAGVPIARLDVVP